FNLDGNVDATDYVVWRKGLGTVYTQSHYAIWRSHFGQTAGSGAVLPSAEPLSAAVPEPTALVLLLIAACTRVNRCRSLEFSPSLISA
ncbi:MAG TPA: PEP-CTERM sorting domain-containing protein, partial [Lacipirellulaceae bacterium]|nr:PEP-CTERM sorting domain-containing protein [Lacipirellulaceae bacterium]